MSYPIIGCPGYSLADDMHTIHNQNGKAVSEENEYVTIVVDGEKHSIQRAKLAWCAMKGVNPFEVSDDDYIFYYSRNTPRKKSTAKISKGTKLNDIEFQKTIKGWAEKNGFFDTKKYLQTMHDFIQRHNISLTGKDDYCVFKQSDKDTILEGMTHAALDKQENSDKQCMVKLDELEYFVFKNRAKENNMTVDEYVIRLLSCVPYNMDDTKLFNLEKAAEKVNKNLWDYIFDLVFNKDSENDKRQNDLKEQVADLKGAIQQITEELEKKQEALSKCKAFASLNALKPILPPMWYVKAIEVTYVNDFIKESFNIELFNDQNNAMIGDMPEDHTRKKYYEGFSSMSVDHFVNIINDAKQRLLTANNYEEVLSDDNIFKDEEYLWNDETSEDNMPDETLSNEESSQNEFSDDDVIEKFRKDLNHQKDKNGENPEYNF